MDTFWRIVFHKRWIFCIGWHDIIEEDDVWHVESEHTSRIWTSDTVGGSLVVVIGPDVMIIGTSVKKPWVPKSGGSVCESVSDRAGGKAVLVWVIGLPDWTWLPSCRTYNLILAFHSTCTVSENCENDQKHSWRGNLQHLWYQIDVFRRVLYFPCHWCPSKVETLVSGLQWLHQEHQTTDQTKLEDTTASISSSDRQIPSVWKCLAAEIPSSAGDPVPTWDPCFRVGLLVENDEKCCCKNGTILRVCGRVWGSVPKKYVGMDRFVVNIHFWLMLKRLKINVTTGNLFEKLLETPFHKSFLKNNI